MVQTPERANPRARARARAPNFTPAETANITNRLSMMSCNLPSIIQIRNIIFNISCDRSAPAPARDATKISACSCSFVVPDERRMAAQRCRM